MRPITLPFLIVLGLIAVIVAGLGTAFLLSPGAFGSNFLQILEVGGVVVLMVMVGIGLWSSGAYGQAVRHALAWVCVGGLLFVAYSYRDQIEWVARRVVAEMSPPVAAIAHEPGTINDKVVIERVRGAQFRIPVTLNGSDVTMLVDTGASVVTLTHDDAEAAGIRTDALNYSAVIFTANGRTTAAPVIVEKIAVGTIERAKVPALVARTGTLERSLLGLSFLDTLASYAISGDKLELTP